MARSKTFSRKSSLFGLVDESTAYTTRIEDDEDAVEGHGDTPERAQAQAKLYWSDIQYEREERRKEGEKRERARLAEEARAAEKKRLRAQRKLVETERRTRIEAHTDAKEYQATDVRSHTRYRTIPYEKTFLTTLVIVTAIGCAFGAVVGVMAIDRSTLGVAGIAAWAAIFGVSALVPGLLAGLVLGYTIAFVRRHPWLFASMVLPVVAIILYLIAK